MTPEEAAAVLGVTVASTEEEVKASFRRRARLTHPDRFAGATQRDLDDASAEFVRVGAARDVLLAFVAARRESPQPSGSNAGSANSNNPRQSSGSRSTMDFETFAAAFEEAAWGETPPPSPQGESQGTGAQPQPEHHFDSSSSSASSASRFARERTVSPPTKQTASRGSWWDRFGSGVTGVVVLVVLLLVLVGDPLWFVSNQGNSDAGVNGPSTNAPGSPDGLVDQEIMSLLDLEWSQSIPIESANNCAEFGCATLRVVAPALLECSAARFRVGFSRTESSAAEQFATKLASIGPGGRDLVFLFPTDEELVWISVDSVECVR